MLSPSEVFDISELEVSSKCDSSLSALSPGESRKVGG